MHRHHMISSHMKNTNKVDSHNKSVDMHDSFGITHAVPCKGLAHGHFAPVVRCLVHGLLCTVIASRTGSGAGGE